MSQYEEVAAPKTMAVALLMRPTFDSPVSDGPDEVLHHATDEQLIAAVRAGERLAREQLYLRHGASVLRLSMRLMRSSSDAEDVMQDTFVTAFEKMGTLRDTSALGGWLLTICVRHAHRRFRRRRIERVLGFKQDVDAGLAAQAAPGLDPERGAELRRLDAALDRLATTDKIVWILHRVEGFTLEETASLCAWASKHSSVGS